MFRQQIVRQARLFSTTPVARKGPVDTIKEAAKKVDKTISGAAVKGIEKGGTSILSTCSLPSTHIPSSLTSSALAENMTTSYGAAT